MFKKMMALVLALTLSALCFGCGKTQSSGEGAPTKAGADKEKETTMQTLPEGSKIAFIVHTAAQDVEFNPVVMQIAEGFDQSVMSVAIPEDSTENTLNIMRTAVATAQDPQVKVMVFSGAAAGVADALRQVRAQRDDVTLIVCDPGEIIAADLAPALDQCLKVRLPVERPGDEIAHRLSHGHRAVAVTELSVVKHLEKGAHGMISDGIGINNRVG